MADPFKGTLAKRFGGITVPAGTAIGDRSATKVQAALEHLLAVPRPEDLARAAGIQSDRAHEQAFDPAAPIRTDSSCR